MIYFWGDPHFCHDAIIEYCARPWKNSHLMDKELIKRYRERVKSSDTVYILGDFTIKTPENKGKIQQIVRQLPGKKILILGNHDYFKPFTYIEMGFWSVHTSLELEDLNMVLVHDPAVAQVNIHKLFVCAHTHTLFKVLRNVICVSVEQWDYYPVALNEIEALRQQMILKGFVIN